MGDEFWWLLKVGVGVLYFYLDFTWKQAHNSISLACKTSLLLLLPQIY